MSLELNKIAVLARIAQACGSAGRDPASVRLVWVSKMQPLLAVEDAIALGAREFGENRVQEALEKFLPPREGIVCRIIGPVQKNKLRKAVSVAQAIDSVADLESIQKLEALCGEFSSPPSHTKTLEVLFQINASQEESKSGVSMQNAEDFLRSIPSPRFLIYKGLMTIGKNTGNPEDSRECFSFLRRLRDKFFNSEAKFQNFTELSMGMTGDLEVAIAEGSTMIRVGTALFGERSAKTTQAVQMKRTLDQG